MIWNETDCRRETDDVAERMAATLDRFCGADPEDSQTGEIAQAVACYLRDASRVMPAPAHDINLLLSRALAAVGEQGAARRMAVFGSGLVVPLEWEIAGETVGWTIDLAKLRVTLELTCFAGVLIVIESLCHVWDDTHGYGLLGLKYTRQVAADTLGVPAKSPRAARLADEIRTLCERKLEKIQAMRHWADRPHVINMEF